MLERTVVKKSHRSDEFPVAMLLVAMDPQTRAAIAHAAGQKLWATTFFEQEEYPSPSRRPSFRSQISSTTFCVAFVDFDASPEDAAGALRFLQETSPAGITLVAVATNSDPELILLAMRAGCAEFLQKPRASVELPDLMDSLELLSIRTERQVAAPGTVLSLMGVKGGVGATSLAVELTFALKKVYGKRTLLVDAHAQLGHSGIYLGIDAMNTFFGDVVHNVNRLDSELLRGFVAQHSSGLHVLCSPDKVQEKVAWNRASLVRTFTFLRSEYEYIVVDSPVEQSEVSHAILEVSSQVFLVSTPEIGAIRDLARSVDRLALIDDVSDKLKVVLNRSVAPFAINTEQIERAIKLPIAVNIPNKYLEFVKAQNLGEPATEGRNAELGSAIKAWASSILGVSGPFSSGPQRKKLFPWFAQSLRSSNATAQQI